MNFFGCMKKMLKILEKKIRYYKKKKDKSFIILFFILFNPREGRSDF